MQQRLFYVDIMRGIAILLVVAAHLIQTNVYEGVNSKAFMAINSFHMPLFFAISGYIAQKVYKPMDGVKSLMVFLKKKAIALLVPFFVWDLIVYRLFFTDLWNWPSFDSLISELTSPRLWFLQTLFLIFVGYSLFSLLSKRWNNKQGLFVDLLLIAFVFILYGMYYITQLDAKRVLLYSIPFYMGLIVAKYEGIEELVYNQYAFAISLFCFCILIGHWDMHSGLYVDDIIKNVISPCAFIIALNVSKRYETNRYAHVISLWGRYSMEIYVAHWAFLMITSCISVDCVGISEIWLLLLAIVLSVPIVYLCIGLAKIIEVSAVTRFIMYGRRAKLIPYNGTNR